MRRQPHWGGPWVAQSERFPGSIHFDASPVCAAIANPTIEEETQTGESLDLPWQVVVHNDPVNLMTYVTMVFQRVFGYPREKAERRDASCVRPQIVGLCPWPIPNDRCFNSHPEDS